MATENPSTVSRSSEWVPLLLLLFVALAWLYRTPYQASGLEVPPDTVEYALAPLQLIETGRYEILLEGRPLPPRYAPWFPALVIAPAYLLFGHQPGNAILPITLLAVAGVSFAWAIGRRITSAAGGVFAGLALLGIPTYSLWGSQVMSDIPCTALMLGAGLLYLNIVERPPSARRDLFAGLLVAVAMLFRPVFAAMMLPFLLAFWQRRNGFLRRTALFLVPLAAAAVAAALYNRAAFGSPWRNGYHFWTPVPYDYPKLTFSLDYVRTNLWVLVHTAFPVVLGVVILAWVILNTATRKVAFQTSRQRLLQFLVFVALTTGPILVFHLFYFFPTDRFHLPLLAGMAVIAGSMVGLLVGDRWMRLLKLLLPALLLLAIIYRLLTPEPAPARRTAADQIHQQTPANAIILSGIDPVYLERMAASGSSRRIVPLSRRVEYASKLLAPQRIDHPNPPPANWHDHRAAGLLRGGAQEAVRFVASEQVDSLATMAAAGTPIFLDATYLALPDAAVLGQLKGRFDFVSRAPNLFELRSR
jgi:4-amino-4-deoxy-L-arabinose transferase-like glycosyltransferase